MVYLSEQENGSIQQQISELCHQSYEINIFNFSLNTTCSQLHNQLSVFYFRIKDMKDQLEQKREEIHGLEMDLEEHQGKLWDTVWVRRNG